MSQAEALLNSLTTTVVDHKHEVPDSDTHFIIDPYTRQIENTTYNKTVLMRGDHNSERFTFEIPRYVDGHDMSLCNRIIVHFDNVGDSIENIYSDVAYLDDLRINPDKPDTVISSWLIRREATQIVGILSFSLQYQCIENEEVTYEWNTDSYDDIEIRKSKNNGEAAIIKYTNVLEQWRSQIFGAGDSVMSNITTEGANQVAAVQNESATQQAAIELKGSETLATIPDDYTEVYNMASEAVRTKADGIVCEVEGEAITFDDSSDDYIRGLNVYGKSTQFTTTGKNLFTFDEPPRVSGISYDETTQKVRVTAGEYAVVQHMYRFDTPIPAGTTVTVTAWFDSGLTGPTASLAIGGYHEAETGSSWQGHFVIDKDTNVSGISKTATFVTTETITSIVFFANAGSTLLKDLVFKLQFEIGDVATAYEPYTGGVASPNPDYPQEIISIEDPIITVNGKNLFDMSKIVAKETITPLPDGTISVSHYYNPTHIALREFAPGLVVGTKCLLNIDTDGCTFLYLSKYGHIWNDNTILEITDEILDSQVCLYGKTEQIDGSTIIRSIQVVVEGHTREYEKYAGTQQLNLTHTLRSVPVTQGGSYTTGNYIDENGKQWICDEVDLERGVYVQRILVQEFTGEEAWTTNPLSESLGTTAYHIYNHNGDMEFVFGLCSHFINAGPWSNGLTSKTNTFWTANATTVVFKTDGIQSLDDFMSFIRHEYESGNPVTFYSVLRTPIETPLTAEEIETYKTLRTNYPNTTVLNNAGAWMKFKYNADTKLYILNNAIGDAAAVVEEVLNATY